MRGIPLLAWNAMAEFALDPYVELYARRTSGMSASEVRALFAVASRPEVVSLAGGMPYVQALPEDGVLRIVREAFDLYGASVLQYCGGPGLPQLRRRLADLMAEEAWRRNPTTSWSDGRQEGNRPRGEDLTDPATRSSSRRRLRGPLSAFSESALDTCR